MFGFSSVFLRVLCGETFSVSGVYSCSFAAKLDFPDHGDLGDSTSVMPSEREPRSGERAERHPENVCSLKANARHFLVNVTAALDRHH